MATQDFLEDGQTRGQELYRMGADSPPSPSRPPAPGSGGPGGGKPIAGTRAAPNGKVLGRANSFAASFLRSVPDAANLAQQMQQPAPGATEASSPSSGDWSDLSRSEAVELYRRMRGGLDQQSRQRLDILAAGLE